MNYDFDEVHNRLGTYCTQWDYIEDRFHKKDLIPFSISDTDFIIPKPITDKINEITKHQIFGYTRWNHDDYKNSISSYFKRKFNTTLKNDWIVYSPTVMYSVSVLIRLLSLPGESVVAFNPMYDAFFNVIEKNDRKLIANDLIVHNGHYEIDFNTLEECLKDAQILLLCNPHNPTGRCWTFEEMKRIICLCKQYHVKIISDEIHMDIQIGERSYIPILSFIDLYGELYTASSSSKTLNTPGLVGSYVLIPNETIKDKFLIQTRQKDFLNSVSIFGMYATMVGYTECDDYIEQLNEYVKNNMLFLSEFIKKEMPYLNFVQPESTYLAWIDASNLPFEMKEIQKALIEVGGIALMDGAIYGESRYKYLRMNVGCPKIKLEDGLKRMKKALDSLYERVD